MLTRVEVVDREKGIVTVGIRRAMDLVLTELDSGKVPNEVVGPLGPPIPTAGEGPAGETAGATQETTAPENQDPAKADAAKADSTKEDQAKDDSTDDGEPEKNIQPPENQDEEKS
jgi:hypothetical protein